MINIDDLRKLHAPRKLIYICSPLRGDYERNIENAKTYSRLVFDLGYTPITPHIYFTQFMDDTVPEQREAVMAGRRKNCGGYSWKRA